MATTITEAFKASTKKHLRISHDQDDELILSDIASAIRNVFEMYMLVPEKLEDGSDNSDYPSSTDDLTESQATAVRHLVTTYRTNPDERIESRYNSQTKMLIERILGPDLGYPGV